MNSRTPRSWRKGCQNLVAVGCAVMLLPGQGLLLAQATTSAASPVTIPPPPDAPAAGAAATAPATSSATPAADTADDPKLSGDQLESLVAPIALYPDSLLAQTLVASTYPLEIVQLQQWLVKNKDLKDKALTDAVAKQPWDPAIQGMATIPDLVKRLADDVQWTTELGNAFLAQQSDVMDAVPRMRKKAQDKGTLTSNEHQKMEPQVVEQKTVSVVQPANPEVIYVPQYNPTVVYPPPVYAYPPVYYPPPGYAFMSFSIGVAVGAAFWGGGCGWGNNDININRNTNINVGNGNVGNGNRGNGNWSHNPSHRGAAPYSNKATANKYGGQGRGQTSAANRGTGASATSRSAGGAGASRSASPTASSRSAGAGASRSLFRRRQPQCELQWI